MPYPYTKIEQEMIKEMFKKGGFVNNIAKKVGKSRAGVRSFILRTFGTTDSEELK